jgi:hypothetical protein
MLAPLREEDSSSHAQSARTDDVLGAVFQEASSLSRTLREQRLRLVNRAGEQLLGGTAERLLGATTELSRWRAARPAPAAEPACVSPLDSRPNRGQHAIPDSLSCIGEDVPF